MELFKLKKISDRIYKTLSVQAITGSVSIHIKKDRLAVVGKKDIIDFIYNSKSLTEEDRELVDFIVEDATPGGIPTSA